MRGTSLMTKRERKRHLEDLQARYGYGKFVGTDGILHEGIEKEPLVDSVPLLGLVKKVQTGLSQKAFGLGYSETKYDMKVMNQHHRFIVEVDRH
jgi:hypothetical protein